MWLIEITIDGTLHRISTETADLEHLWHGYVDQFTPISYRCREETGGYIEPSFGSMDISMAMFEGSFPPATSSAITVKYTDTTEAAAVLLFTGYAHMSRMSRSAITFNFFGDGYSSSIQGVTLSDTLGNIFSTYCGGSYLNLSLDASAARSPSPSISRASSTSPEMVVDILSEIAAATNHFFYINNGTLYLCDMLADNGTGETITEFDFMPVEYSSPGPCSLFRSGDYSVAGSYAYGSVKDLGVSDVVAGVNVSGHLTSAKSILEKSQFRMKRPISAANIPTFGQKISWSDESIGPTGSNVSFWFRVRGITFSENGEFLTIEGEGDSA